MTTLSQTAVATSTQSRFIQLAAAALLGLFVVGFAGLAQSDVVHNAAHDYRHAMGFPCH
jgi:cobalt transporter subunit CbtB